MMQPFFAADAAVPAPDPQLRPCLDPRALRVGLVCPYSLESPGGVQNHVLGLARPPARAGPPAVGAGPRRAAGRRPPPLDPGPLHQRRRRGAGALQRLGRPGELRPAHARPGSGAGCARGRFDLLHVHEPVTPSIALLALWAAEQPVVATFHTATPRSRSMQLAGGVLRPAVEKLDARIAVSETARLVVVQHLGARRRGHPQRLPVRRLRRATRRAVRTGRRPRLLFLGRTDEPRKGLDVLLAALPAIRRAEPDLEVVVAGRGAPTAAARMRRLGLVSEAEKVALLSSADVFVAPHRARESFGIVVVEAMASGVPVVASDLPRSSTCSGRAAPGNPAAGTRVPGRGPDGLARAVVDELRAARPGPDPPGPAAGPPLRLVGRRGTDRAGVPDCAHRRPSRHRPAARRLTPRDLKTGRAGARVVAAGRGQYARVAGHAHEERPCRTTPKT